MSLPALEIVPGESVFQASGRLERLCREQGIQLVGFETLNSLLPTSRYSNFFQARVEGRETIFLVMTGEWTNAALVAILNVLLEIRSDPDPPGSKLHFRIHSAYPVPALVDTLFGEHRISPVECRAAMLARFGSELAPRDCTRLAAAAMPFLSSLGVKTHFRDPAGATALTGVLVREVRDLRLPPEGAPLNFLICAGCLYGEIVRSGLEYETEWSMVKEYQPWPCLVVRPRSTPVHGASTRFLGFSPIGLVIQLSQGGPVDLLEKSASALADRCRAEFQPVGEGTHGSSGSFSST